MIDTQSGISAGVGTTLLLTGLSLWMGAVLALPVAWARSSSIWPLRLAAGTFIPVARGVVLVVWLRPGWSMASGARSSRTSSRALVLAAGMYAAVSSPLALLAERLGAATGRARRAARRNASLRPW